MLDDCHGVQTIIGFVSRVANVDQYRCEVIAMAMELFN